MNRGQGSGRRAVVHGLTCAALVAGGLVAAGGAAAEPTQDGEVGRIALTDAVGAPTQAGLGGWDAATTASADDRAAADDAAEEPVLLTAATETDPFYVLALTWDLASGPDPDARFFVRVLEDAAWSDWLEVQAEQGGRDDAAVAGTEAFVTGGATGVQVQVDSDAALPADLTLSLIPADVEEEGPLQDEVGEVAALEPDTAVAVGADEADLPVDDWSEWVDDDATTTSSSAGGAAGTVVGGGAGARAVPPGVQDQLVSPQLGGAQPMSPVIGGPGVHSRADWGVNNSSPGWTQRFVDLRGAVLHHTAGTNSYSRSEVPGIIRGIYHFHSVTRGWGDIGYNFLVDRFGQAWEGRAGTLRSPAGQMVIGGHARPLNTNTLGISVMGTYTNQRASTTVMNTLADVIAWQFARAGIDMNRSTELFGPGREYGGSATPGARLPTIFGHSAVSATTCPGMMLGQLPALRQAVAERLPWLWYLRNDNGENADVTMRYSEVGAQTFWGDWDGDGIDTPASRVGSTIYIRNSLTYGFPSFSFTFGRPDAVLLVGDWDGDGVDTFAVRDGYEYRFYNSFSGRSPAAVVHYGWSSDEVFVGDWDGDGVDTLAVRRGQVFHATNSIADGPAEFRFRYGVPGDRYYVGDWDGDGRDTLVVRRGNLYLFNDDLGLYSDYRMRIGSTPDHVVVGDWDRDGEDTMGIRRR